MKTLVARLIGDAWVVEVTDRTVLASRDEVKKVIREHGLNFREEFSDENKYFAD
uniref:Uncharacterized protein n=1 Tax=viral metagenome TaxID=1070528 RepID=A0A6M3JEF0_9ZZZZ